MVKIIRYANEGFINYNHTIKVEDTEIEVTGCFVFVKKVFPKALRYERGTLEVMGKGLPIRNRNKDTKNEAFLSEDTPIYARLIDPDKLFIAKSQHGIFVQPEFMGDIDDKKFSLTTVKTFYENIEKYEILEKKLKKEAKSLNLPLEFFNTPFYFYEAIVKAEYVIS